ncbi:MAG: hypothetical protein NTU53_05915 [Planctomycetota bacterium]|nr:hypothetical protein [Planctomycetota bacterium]
MDTSGNNPRPDEEQTTGQPVLLEYRCAEEERPTEIDGVKGVVAIILLIGLMGVVLLIAGAPFVQQFRPPEMNLWKWIGWAFCGLLVLFGAWYALMTTRHYLSGRHREYMRRKESKSGEREG